MLFLHALKWRICLHSIYSSLRQGLTCVGRGGHAGVLAVQSEERRLQASNGSTARGGWLTHRCLSACAAQAVVCAEGTQKAGADPDAAARLYSQDVVRAAGALVANRRHVAPVPPVNMAGQIEDLLL